MNEGKFSNVSQEEFNNKKRPERADRVAEFLRKTAVFNYINNIFEKDEKPSFEEFKNFLIRINGIAREIPIKGRAFDGKLMSIQGIGGAENLFPKDEDKEGLLKLAYSELVRTDRNDLKYSMPAIINAIHFFADGNGRTSRTLHQLLENYDSENEMIENLKIALGEDGRVDTPDINPSLIKNNVDEILFNKHDWNFSDSNFPDFVEKIRRYANAEEKQIDINHKNYKYTKEFFLICKSTEDIKYISAALCAILKDNIGEILTQKYGGNDISPILAAKKISESEWQNILDLYWKLKKEYVEILIDVFAHPELHIINEEDESKVTLKDEFIRRVKGPKRAK